MIVDLALVIPVYHCAGRLQRTLGELERFLEQSPVRCEVILVDDRGTDPTAGSLLQDFARRPDVRLLCNDRNRGKGYSVRRGMLETTAAFRIFTDADLAYPLDEVWRIAAALHRGADVAIATRVHAESRYHLDAGYLTYRYTRYAMSRAFNGMVRLALLPGLTDTQAGLKGYTARAADDVFSRVGIGGFGFDLECLYLARQLDLRVDQVPVRFQYDDEPSTVRYLRDAVTMAGDLARIRWRAWTGKYQLSPACHTPGASSSTRTILVSREA